MLSVIAALFAHILLGPKLLATESLFVLFLVPVILSAWYGGRGPGLLATTTGAVVADYLILDHATGGSVVHVNIMLSLFVAAGVLISLLGGMLQQSESRNIAIMRSAIDGVITLDLGAYC